MLTFPNRLKHLELNDIAEITGDNPSTYARDSYTSLGNLTTSRTSEEQRQSLRACTWAWTRSASWTKPRMRPSGPAPTVKTRQFYQFCINIKKFIILWLCILIENTCVILHIVFLFLKTYWHIWGTNSFLSIIPNIFLRI